MSGSASFVRASSARRFTVGLVAVALLSSLPLIVPQRAQAAHSIDHIYYTYLRNVETQMCVEVKNFYVHNGAPIVLHPCTGGANQKWKVYYYTNGDSRYVNVHSRKCLEVVNYYRHQGAKLVQWTCHAGANQLWRERDYRNGIRYTYRSWAVANKNSGLCLDAPGRVRFAQVQQWGCNGTNWQQWIAWNSQVVYRR